MTSFSLYTAAGGDVISAFVTFGGALHSERNIKTAISRDICHSVKNVSFSFIMLTRWHSCIICAKFVSFKVIKKLEIK